MKNTIKVGIILSDPKTLAPIEFNKELVDSFIDKRKKMLDRYFGDLPIVGIYADDYIDKYIIVYEQDKDDTTNYCSGLGGGISLSSIDYHRRDVSEYLWVNPNIDKVKKASYNQVKIKGKWKRLAEVVLQRLRQVKGEVKLSLEDHLKYLSIKNLLDMCFTKDELESDEEFYEELTNKLDNNILYVSLLRDRPVPVLMMNILRFKKALKMFNNKDGEIYTHLMENLENMLKGRNEKVAVSQLFTAKETSVNTKNVAIPSDGYKVVVDDIYTN